MYHIFYMFSGYRVKFFNEVILLKYGTVNQLCMSWGQEGHLSMDERNINNSDSTTNRDENTSHLDDSSQEGATNRHVKEGIFMAALAGFSIIGGFGMTLAMAKKRDPGMFAKGLLPTHELPESGGSLAMRALAWGTLYSVAGVGSLCFAVWKLLGVNNSKEFREKMGKMLPRIPKKENPGRSDFKTVRELFEYIIDEDNKQKRVNKS